MSAYDPVPTRVVLPEKGEGVGEWIYQTSLLLNQTLSRVYIPVVKRVAVSHTVLPRETYIGVTNTDSARTITLPERMVDGDQIVVKDESGLAGTNNITVTRGGSADLIDGATTSVISANYGSLRIQYDGAGNWFII